MSEQKLKMMLIKGVRKLKRTVLHVQVNVSKDNASKEKSSKKRRISVTLNSGGSDHSSDIELKEEPQTLNIWFPLAVLQEEIRLTSHKVKMGKDEKIVDMIIDVNSLTNDKNTELSRSHVKEMVIVVKAITSDLPHIPIRQKGEKVYDYSKYFKIPQLTTSEMMRCPSGLVYLHIHRATGLPAKDMKHFGSSDPYCVVVLNKEDILKTQVVYKQLNPVFNFFEDFFVQNIASISELEVKVFDFDNFSDDDYIGNVKINLSNVFPKVVDKGFEVKDTNGKQVGLIYLSIIFRPIEFPPTSHNLSNILLNNFGTVDIL